MSAAVSVLLSILSLVSTTNLDENDRGSCLEQIPGYVHTVFDERVFYISQGGKSWTEAYKTCETLQGRLAVLADRAAFDHVRETLKTTAGEGTLRYWVGLRWISGKYVWLSGESHDHKIGGFWKDGDDDAIGDYVSMVPTEFLFNNARNVNSYGFICEKDRTVYPLGRHGGKGFFLVTRALTWNRSLRLCQSCTGGSLAEIRDNDTQRFLQTSAVGVVPVPNPQVYWIGLQWQRPVPGNETWQWATGEEFDCKRTNSLFPCQQVSADSLIGSERLCMHISTPDFYWGTDDCTESGRGSLCEQVLDTTTELPGSTSDISEVSSKASTSTENTTVPLVTTSAIAPVTENVLQGRKNTTETEVVTLSGVHIGIIVGVAVLSISAAVFLKIYLGRRSRKPTVMEDVAVELLHVPRSDQDRTGQQYSNATYGEVPSSPSQVPPTNGVQEVSAVQATSENGALHDADLLYVNQVSDSAVSGERTYDHAFQTRPNAREATQGVYSHLQGEGTAEAENETYDRAFQGKRARARAGVTNNTYGFLAVDDEGKDKARHDCAVLGQAADSEDARDKPATGSTAAIMAPPEDAEPTYYNQ